MKIKLECQSRTIDQLKKDLKKKDYELKDVKARLLERIRELEK